MAADAYFGRRLRSRQAGAFSFVETDYHAAAAIPEHEHERAYLCVVTAGSYEEEGWGRCFHCEGASIVLHGQGTRHRDRFGPRGGRCLNVAFEEGWPEELFGSAFPSGDSLCVQSVALWPLARRLHAAFLLAEEGSELLLEERATEILGAFFQERRGAAAGAVPWLRAVEERLRSAPDETPRLLDLARLAGVHPAHLTRAFRRRHGCSPGEFLRALRVEAAARAMLEEHASLAEIAHRHGFCDQSHLNRVFRQRTGAAPGTYRRAARVCGQEAAPTSPVPRFDRPRPAEPGA